MALPLMEIEVKGSHFEIGAAVGEAARELIGASIEYYEEHHQTMAGMSFASAEREASRYLAVTRRWIPDIVAELEGMSAGSGVPASRLLVPNLGEEFTCSDQESLLRQEALAKAQHCTSIALSDGERVVIAHNEDWYSDDEARNVLLRIELPDGTRIVSITAGCLLAASGINSHGLATCANTVLCNDCRVGVPNNLIRRWVLEAGTLEEARARICLDARARGANHLFGTADGRIVDFETSATSHVTLEPDAWFVHTNHYLSDSMTPLQMGLDLEGSRARLECASTILRTGLDRGDDLVDLAMSVLASHGECDDSICRHPDCKVREGDRSSTTASMVWDLEAMEAHVCAGPPCSNERVSVSVG